MLLGPVVNLHVVHQTKTTADDAAKNAKAARLVTKEVVSTETPHVEMGLPLERHAALKNADDVVGVAAAIFQVVRLPVARAMC